MLNYFTIARRFPFVLMLGDNLYDDDYESEFLRPYRPLLDRGVTFFAALGNHDRDLEQHFKPFNMQEGHAGVAVFVLGGPADDTLSSPIRSARSSDIGPHAAHRSVTFTENAVILVRFGKAQAARASVPDGWELPITGPASTG